MYFDTLEWSICNMLELLSNLAAPSKSEKKKKKKTSFYFREFGGPIKNGFISFWFNWHLEAQVHALELKALQSNKEE
jgi:hypothetical protein